MTEFKRMSYRATLRVGIAMIPFISATQAFAQADDSQPASAATANRPAGAEADDSDLVIVTAQKRAQNVQDVPTSLVVLNGESLEDQGIDTLADLTKVVPGLTLVGSSNPGRGRPVLRGMSTGGDRTSPQVGLYLDDVPFTVSSIRPLMTGFTFDPVLVDLERIEVLKGPQSTLYGASALSGLIKYVSKAPNLTDFEALVKGELETTDDGGSGHLARASVNIPIVDGAVAIRATGVHRKIAGFIDELGSGNKNINSTTMQGGRASLRIKFSEDFETTVSGMYQDTDSPGGFGGVAIVSAADHSLRFGKPAYRSILDEYTRIKYKSLSNTAVWDLPFAQITNISSYARSEIKNKIDTSNFAAFFPATDIRTAFNLADLYAYRLTNELRVTSKPGTLEWMLGAFYTRERSRAYNLIRGADINGDVLPASSPVMDLNTFDSRAKFRETALFGNLTYHVTKELGLQAGIRFSWNKQDFNTLSTASPTATPFFAPICCFGHVTKDQPVNYLASITYEPNNNVTIYARVASAYRPGGGNVLTPVAIAAGVPLSFEPDTIWNYEVGVKGSTPNRLLTYSAAAYYMDWKNIQVPVVDINNRAFVGNVGKAQNYGAEAQFTLRPLENLSLGVTASYNDPSFLVPAPRIGVVAGDKLPFASKLASTFFVDYSARISDDVELDGGLVVAYRSSFWNGLRTTPSPGLPTPFWQKLPGYTTVDARAGISFSNYRLLLRVENLFNKWAFTSIGGSSYPAQPAIGNPIRPRTFSLGLEAKF